MRTAASPDGSSASDLTARAKIRYVAIACFAEEGFGASFRTIAARAGVSPGLITHHFGSKAALRAECDAEVLRRYLALKTEAVGNPSGYLLEWLAAPGVGDPIFVYMLRAIHAGGQPARDFLESLVNQVRPIMAESVASGMVRPSCDEEARLRYLVHETMGTMLVRFLVAPDLTPETFVASLHVSGKDAILPALELYTEGLFTGRGMLDDYLQYLWEPPDGQARPESRHQGA